MDFSDYLLSSRTLWYAYSSKLILDLSLNSSAIFCTYDNFLSITEFSSSIKYKLIKYKVRTKIDNDFTGPVEGVLDIEKILDLWSYTVIFLSKDSLEHREVVLSHFVNNLVECVKEGIIIRVFSDIEDRWLESLRYHIVPIQNLLG